MFTILQALDLAEDCFLSEVLLWLGVKRLPQAIYLKDQEEFRFSDENDLLCGSFSVEEISEAECALAGLPPNPMIIALINDTYFNEVEFYDDLLKRIKDWGNEELAKFTMERARAVEFRTEVNNWEVIYNDYIDYFKASLFIDLRDGRLRGRGIKINGNSRDNMIAENESTEAIHKRAFVEIPKEEWKLNKMDWTENILYGSAYSYCWVSFSVHDMLTVYPIPPTISSGSISRLGDVFIYEDAKNADHPVQGKRGRPGLPWEQFHLEVAALVGEKKLPEKKEAAIHHFEAWFLDTLGIRVGRSSIGQKLTPYYQRFVREQAKNGSH